MFEKLKKDPKMKDLAIKIIAVLIILSVALLSFDVFTQSKDGRKQILDEDGGTEEALCAILTDMKGCLLYTSIVEEVMGDIDDEYDEEEPEIEKIDDHTYIVDGATDLDDLNEELGTDLESENSETIGGFIIDILGEIPDEDEDEERVVEYENYVFRIESVKDRRIEKVKLYIMPKKEEPEEDESEEKESRKERREKEKKEKEKAEEASED